MELTKIAFIDAAEIFKALSHPTRIFILYCINERPHTVTELSEKAEIDISTMSKHLDVLKKNKIIYGNKSRNEIFYKIKMLCVLKFLDCAQSINDCSQQCLFNTKENSND